MAVFLVNSCKFNGCGQIYSTLSELIQHIEETHLDTDPQILELQEIQQPPSVALSYVCRVFTDAATKEKRPRLVSLSPVSSLRSATPTGSEFDDEEAGHSSEEDSDDSWTTQEEFTSELILSMMTNTNKDSSADKPFACPVPSCKKRYKNINGIKYHAKHGHKKEVRVKKPYKCKCGKSYKTSIALQTHSQGNVCNQGTVPSLLQVTKQQQQLTNSETKPKLVTPKIKAGGLVGKLPVAALASQAQARKQIHASLKNSVTSLPQAVFAPNGQPTQALVTVPVTFGKFTTGSSKKDGGNPPQQMLNLIAPTGLVPPGTTITVPMEQITRNLALLQHVNKSGPVANNSVNNNKNSLLAMSKEQWSSSVSSSSSNRFAQSIPEMSVPNCMLTEEDSSPFAFTESGFEDDLDHDEEMAELDKSSDQIAEFLSLDSAPTTPAKMFSEVLGVSRNTLGETKDNLKDLEGTQNIDVIQC